MKSNLSRKFTDNSSKSQMEQKGSMDPFGRDDLARLLRALSVKGNELVDFRAGSGSVLFSSLAEEASGSYGYELPENEGMKYFLNAMLIASATLAQDRAEWIGKDIIDVRELKENPSCAFSFWVGFPFPVQENILLFGMKYEKRD